jgi:hypothetical protein
MLKKNTVNFVINKVKILTSGEEGLIVYIRKKTHLDIFIRATDITYPEVLS